MEPEAWAALFSQFWTAYPRKEAKHAARRAWNGPVWRYFAKNVSDPALALQSILDWVTFVESEASEPRFIPYPATFLRAQDFMDTPPATVPLGGGSEWDRVRQIHEDTSRDEQESKLADFHEERAKRRESK